ncbi:hypothetical protein KOW79_018365 [Hemibagrus wyckioides]|uniref:V-SNARE coiled-coil homology domain-containing protein n=1 Tax=Hemibagrus wyckioides TaxID=337641 RepID=A0A9D3NAK0_9TELE|nr:hypothetical protein KOW79_018365 [Hemibagrus wyckioides]
MEKGENRLQQLQGDVEDTKVIMVDTYNKAIDRRINLEELEERAEVLLESSRRFHMTSMKVREKVESENSRMCKNQKMIAIGIGAGLVIILLIIIISSSWP